MTDDTTEPGMITNNLHEFLKATIPDDNTKDVWLIAVYTDHDGQSWTDRIIVGSDRINAARATPKGAEVIEYVARDILRAPHDAQITWRAATLPLTPVTADAPTRPVPTVVRTQDLPAPDVIRTQDLRPHPVPDERTMFPFPAPERKITIDAVPGTLPTLRFATLTDDATGKTYPALTAEIRQPHLNITSPQTIALSIALTPAHISGLITDAFSFLWEHHPEAHAQLMREIARWRW